MTKIEIELSTETHEQIEGFILDVIERYGRNLTVKEAVERIVDECAEVMREHARKGEMDFS